MAQNRYKWDIEGMAGNLNILKNEKNKLREYLMFLRGMRAEIDKNWESVAGAKFGNYVEVDEKDLRLVIDGAEEIIRMLDKIIFSYYQDCEDKIGQKMRELQGDIRRI